MNNKALLFFAIFLVIAGAVFWWPNDEKKIKDNLASLAEYCSSGKAESVVETLQKVALAVKLCTDPCIIQFESLKIDRKFSNKELSDHFLMMKKRLPVTDFSFHDSIIDISEDNSAKVTTTLRLTGKAIDEQFTDAYEINITTEKKDGDWLFSSFTVVEFIRK